jgi:hypothetical protein
VMCVLNSWLLLNSLWHRRTSERTYTNPDRASSDLHLIGALKHAIRGEKVWECWRCNWRTEEVAVSTKFEPVQEGDSWFCFSLAQGYWSRWRFCSKMTCVTHPYIYPVCPKNHIILDGVIGIFYWHNPFGRTMALESTQPLT